MTFFGAVALICKCSRNPEVSTPFPHLQLYKHKHQIISPQVEIIANDQGNRTTPSYVAFTDTERLIGDPAKNQVAINPTNTIFDAKRLIGRKFNDSNVQTDRKHWPFQVVDSNGLPKLKVEYQSEEKTFTPEEISSCMYT